MPHYRCVACKVRLHVSGSPAELVGDLCPECGCLLEPVADLREIIGFRSIKSLDPEPDAERSGSHQRLADLLAACVSRQAASLERDRLDVERRLENAEHPGAAEIALPPPQTYR